MEKKNTGKCMVSWLMTCLPLVQTIKFERDNEHLLEQQ